MGYTNKGELVILVVEGRHKNVSVGVSLIQLAAMMQSLGCVEALNLDGGGSTCMLIQGRPVIRVSDLKDGEPTQRPVPGVFMIYSK
jgi:exopolysaccharide biosynthesis protein